MTQGEAIDLMDDARNNPPLNDEGERAATNPVATPRAQLPTVSDLAEILSGVSAAIINDDFEAHDYHIRRYTDAITAVYSRLAELEKDAARLDWLEARPDLTVTTDDTTPAGFSYLFPSYDTRATLRAAIDAAMSAPTPKAEV